MQVVRDQYGNTWRTSADGRIEATTPDGDVVVVWNRPDAPATDVATDDHGFAWVVAGERVYFTNPRATADSEPPDQSEQQPGSAGVFTAVKAHRLPGRPIRLQRSDEGMMLAHCASDAGTVVVELQVVGRDIGGPFTSGHTTEVTVSQELTAANAAWEVLSARLPCGTHDNFCTTADGRVFIAGGATHHRGYPATNHIHEELLAYDPGEPDAGWVVVGRIPGGCVYSSMAALDGRVWVIGGGERGPGRAKCWRFDASSTSEAAGDRQAAPPLPSPRFGCVAVTANGRIWVVGGSGGEGDRAGPLRELLSIGPGETEWRVEPPAPVPLQVATVAGCELDGIIYVLGGVPARFLAFDTVSSTWDESLPNHPLGSQAAAMTAHEGEIWVCGGGVITDPGINPDRRGDKRIYSRKVHAFSPAERRWVEQPDLPCEQNWGAACSLGGRLMVIAGAHRSQSAGAYVFDNRVLMLR